MILIARHLACSTSLVARPVVCLYQSTAAAQFWRRGRLWIHHFPWHSQLKTTKLFEFGSTGLEAHCLEAIILWALYPLPLKNDGAVASKGAPQSLRPGVLLIYPSSKTSESLLFFYFVLSLDTPAFLDEGSLAFCLIVYNCHFNKLQGI